MKLQYKVISDSSPLIAFIKKRELELLKKLFGEIMIPEAVYSELIKLPERYIIEKQILESAIQDGWIIVSKLKALKLSKLKLGKGEIEAINLCFNVQNPLLLMDEKKGRNLIKTYKIKTLGTLGILILAKRKALKDYDNLLENLELLLKEGFYLSSDLITTYLKNIKN
ncbi:MAG: hypothetical protein ACFFDN_12505 [Candidatus Hodarchaeota archaeon]